MRAMPDYDFDFAPTTYWPGDWATGLNREGNSWARWAMLGYDPEAKPLALSMPAVDYSGAYLPASRGNEVEIARVELKSTLGDVTSLRARLSRSGRIYYRMVDEYGTDYTIVPKSSRAPLTMGRLVNLIDTAVAGEEKDHEIGFADVKRDRLLEAASPEDLVDFVQISSFYYPQLKKYYEDYALEWLRRYRELWEEEESEPEE